MGTGWAKTGEPCGRCSQHPQRRAKCNCSGDIPSGTKSQTAVVTRYAKKPARPQPDRNAERKAELDEIYGLLDKGFCTPQSSWAEQREGIARMIGASAPWSDNNTTIVILSRHGQLIRHYLKHPEELPEGKRPGTQALDEVNPKVNTYGGWEELGWQVRKGQKAHLIAIPTLGKKRDKSGEVQVNDDGEEITYMRFTWKPVAFTLDQCDRIPGTEPIPMVSTNQDPEDVLARTEELAKKFGYKISRQSQDTAIGSMNPASKEIWSDPNITDPMRRALVHIHELAHVVDVENSGLTPSEFLSKYHLDRRFRAHAEMVAESTAGAIGQRLFGQESEEFSKSYLGFWADSSHIAHDETDALSQGAPTGTIAEIGNRATVALGAIWEGLGYDDPVKRQLTEAKDAAAKKRPPPKKRKQRKRKS